MIHNIWSLQNKMQLKRLNICILKLIMAPEGQNIARREEKKWGFFKLQKNISQKIYLWNLQSWVMKKCQIAVCIAQTFI